MASLELKEYVGYKAKEVKETSIKKTDDTKKAKDKTTKKSK